MKSIKVLSAVMAIAAVLLSSACSRGQNSDVSDMSSEMSSESSVFVEPDPTPIRGIVIPTEFNNDDSFLQNIVTQKAPSAIECTRWFSGALLYDRDVDGEFEEKEFMFAGSDVPSPYYPATESFPQTAEAMEKYLKQYFTSDLTSKYMNNFSKGTMTENSDGTFAVEVADGKQPTRFIEIDGKLYCSDSSSGSGLTAAYWNTAKVTSQTDDTIVFTYIYAYYNELVEGEGMLKKEDGNWKFARCEGWLIN